MHTDSRNPVVYISGLKATDYYGNKFAFDLLYGYDVLNYKLQNIDHTMYVDEHNNISYDTQSSDLLDMQYVKLKDYNKIKAMLENLERKHAKLKRRHENLGSKYLLVRQERNYLIKEYTNHSEMDYT